MIANIVTVRPEKMTTRVGSQ